MNEPRIGMLARSKAGHDKDNIYIIINADSTYAYLADGKSRTLERLKKKKWRHVQLIKAEYEIMSMKNETIRHILKNGIRTR